ncbi:hypothetical protein NQZ68_007684 [Dissostichus eleginoides]|nr:hypothetical protein NQZ68_007684 [Dissostichus eleginoides]
MSTQPLYEAEHRGQKGHSGSNWFHMTTAGITPGLRQPRLPYSPRRGIVQTQQRGPRSFKLIEDRWVDGVLEAGGSVKEVTALNVTLEVPLMDGQQERSSRVELPHQDNSVSHRGQYNEFYKVKTMWVKAQRPELTNVYRELCQSLISDEKKKSNMRTGAQGRPALLGTSAPTGSPGATTYQDAQQMLTSSMTISKSACPDRLLSELLPWLRPDYSLLPPFPKHM